MGWLILLMFIVVIVGFVMHFRRQAKAREAASEERMKAFLDQARAGTNAAGVAPAASAPSAQVATNAVPKNAVKPQAVQSVTGIALRAPLLNAEQAAAYRLLRKALPDHEVFAQVSLAAFVAPGNDVSGFAREAALCRLTDTAVDFLVCDAALTPLVAVQCGARSTGKAAEAAAYARGCADSVGVRWIELPQQMSMAGATDAAALRQRVLGA